MTRIAVAGLGSMGSGMARRCVAAGHAVWGLDVNEDAASRFVADGGREGPLPDDLDALMIVVLNAAQTEAVLFGEDGLADALPEGAVVIACATVAPDFARAMAARCAERGLLYLDAPISGGSLKAADGTLSVMASGSDAAFAAARPALDAVAATVFELGPEPGAGSAMKAVNQMLVGIHIAAMGEAITFGMTQGVAPDAFLDVIRECAGNSWALDNRAPHVVEGDYAPRSQVDIWPKDLGIVLDIARAAKFPAPVTAAAMQQFLAASGMGLGREDDAAVAKVYARLAGLTLPGEA